MVIIEPMPETSAPMIDCLATGAAPIRCSAPAIDQLGTTDLESRWRRLAHGLDLYLRSYGIVLTNGEVGA